jgi:hypothetical protein
MQKKCLIESWHWMWSYTLDRLLQDTTGGTASQKIADYQRANKEVAIL